MAFLDGVKVEVVDSLLASSVSTVVGVASASSSLPTLIADEEGIVDDDENSFATPGICEKPLVSRVARRARIHTLKFLYPMVMSLL